MRRMLIPVVIPGCLAALLLACYGQAFGARQAVCRSRRRPFCLKPGGRVAILTFHSGEDRRVKQAFKDGLRDGTYSSIAKDVLRASAEERRANPRSSAAKLRFAARGPSS